MSFLILNNNNNKKLPTSLCLSSLQIRTVCYGSQLVGGVLSRRAEADVRSQRLGKSLLLFSAQLSHCRTVLRLFDDLSMLAYSHSYGFGNGVIHTAYALHHSVLACKSHCNACCTSFQGGGRGRALDIRAEQRSGPAVLPL